MRKIMAKNSTETVIETLAKCTMNLPKVQNKSKEDIHPRVIRAWIKRYIENGENVVVETSADDKEYIFTADDLLTLVRIEIMFENINRKGTPQDNSY